MKNWTILDQWTILWPHPRLEWWDQICQHVHARLRQKVIIIIPYCPTINNSVFPIPMYPSKLWRKSSNEKWFRHIGTSSPHRNKVLQRVIVNFLYYGCAVYSTTLAALRLLYPDQSQGNQATMDSLIWFIDYMAMQTDAMVRFYSSNMILTNHSDVLYLSWHKARFQSRGHFYLGNKTTNHTMLHNGAILYLFKTLRNVIASSAEAEIGDFSENAKDAAPIFH